MAQMTNISKKICEMSKSSRGATELDAESTNVEKVSVRERTTTTKSRLQIEFSVGPRSLLQK